jgi:bacteriocin biosynthesis cyclodehydratase domain-containing protein
MNGVHLIATGDFGVAVAERLQASRPELTITSPGTSAVPLTASSAWPSAALRVLLAWREAPRLAETLDARSADWRTPWLPVVMEHPRLRVGPVVVPGAGACYRCFLRRRQQHEPDTAVTAALHAHYDAEPTAGPRGYLPHHVTLAAALAEAALTRFDDGTLAGQAGLVRHYHLLEHQVSSAHVTGLHGCPRCRRHDPAVSTWRQLAAEVSALVRPGPADPVLPNPVLPNPVLTHPVLADAATGER